MPFIAGVEFKDQDMLTRYFQAKTCLVIYQVAISCFSVGVIGLMRTATQFA